MRKVRKRAPESNISLDFSIWRLFAFRFVCASELTIAILSRSRQNTDWVQPVLHAWAAERGDRATDESRSGLERGDPRDLNGGPEHGSSLGAATGRSAQAGGMTSAQFLPTVFALINFPKARTTWEACGKSPPAVSVDVLRGVGIDHIQYFLYLSYDIAFPSPTLTNIDDGAVHGDSTLWLDHAVSKPAPPLFIVSNS